jgi:hypothetical protein
VPPPAGLAPNERRRATLATRLALEAARQATEHSAEQAPGLLSVFASSDGDMSLIEQMCGDIYRHGGTPSPTVFQNSVHNAPAGYWSIAEGCKAASTSISAGDGSFAAGLLEAAVQTHVCLRSVLLVAFDLPAPPLLHPYRNFSCAFACALLLTPASGTDVGPILDLALRAGDSSDTLTVMHDPRFEALRTGNPAARALPLLAAAAGCGPSTVGLPYWPDLRLEVSVHRPG